MNTDPSSAPLFCPHCGYDLRTLTGDGCPECGGEIDREALSRSQIPWVHRATQGRLRTFWSTVWHSTFHTRHLAYEMIRPVDYRDARRFQAALVIWLMAWLIGAIGVWAGLASMAPRPIAWWPMLMGGIALAVFASLFLITATGVPSYWFHPRGVPVERQNRAIALSYYASAPLAFLPLAGVILAVGVAAAMVADDLRQPTWWYVALAVVLIGAALLGVIPLGWWRRCLELASATVQRQGGSLALMAICLPITWLLLAATFLVLIPGAIVWGGLAIYTLLW